MFQNGSIGLKPHLDAAESHFIISPGLIYVDCRVHCRHWTHVTCFCSVEIAKEIASVDLCEAFFFTAVNGALISVAMIKGISGCICDCGC
jgi:hypothetical protein